MTYIYRREDNDELIEVDFETAMQQQYGAIRLPDGVYARRCVSLELERDGVSAAPSGKAMLLNRPIVSDTLGFCQHQLADFEADRVKNGFTGVEFKQDPRVPEFYQVHVSGPEEHRRYIEHRGYSDMNSSNGGGKPFTPEQFEEAQRKVKEQYG
jgi:hypothetical protein